MVLVAKPLQTWLQKGAWGKGTRKLYRFDGNCPKTEGAGQRTAYVTGLHRNHFLRQGCCDRGFKSHRGIISHFINRMGSQQGQALPWLDLRRQGSQWWPRPEEKVAELYKQVQSRKVPWRRKSACSSSESILLPAALFRTGW